jgi:glucokinase
MNAVGVDVGGTKIAAAVVTPKGRILNEVRYPTQAVPPNRLVETIARAITEVKDGFEVGGVCLAVPGLILAAENKVIFAPNLHEIENIRLDQEIGGTVGMSVTVENDANAAAWGEFRFGAGIDVEHQVFVTLGTGVGGGIITHGVLLRGAQGAGSWGTSPSIRWDRAAAAATTAAWRRSPPAPPSGAAPARSPTIGLNRRWADWRSRGRCSART